jgi:hypothetical protein
MGAPPQTVGVPEVDAGDDAVKRFVVLRRSYDPARREWRDAVVAAFDNVTEFEAAIDGAAVDLSRRRQSGEDVDPRENVSGAVWGPGYHRKQRAGRTLRQAIKHGAKLDDETWARLSRDAPPGMAVLRSAWSPDQ